MEKTYKKHVFVCTNKRQNSINKSCGDAGFEIRTYLKNQIIENTLNKEIRINKSGCLGKCAQGPCLVIYPDGEWKFSTSLNECKTIIKELENS